ncbi:unnamed protein product [Chironomus riparius]|uniref:Uncharacterized protein n=1 Tax=Chironomus riparius TaxID=315576 RepID=A0A9N9RPI7_9DIPT|nr:unnamed protein product [Chironomus riparius]
MQLDDPLKMQQKLKRKERLYTSSCSSFNADHNVEREFIGLGCKDAKIALRFHERIK